jgi:serine/threonine protein kinase/tetratricopeptide (TPR) repeat protein
MDITPTSLEELSPEQRRLLVGWLTDFDRDWRPDLLASRVRALPASGSLRYQALLGMVRIDLVRQWQQGNRRQVEDYLKWHLELGTPNTVPLDLIWAEVEAHRQAGSPIVWDSFYRRFPTKAKELRKRVSAGGPTAQHRNTDGGSPGPFRTQVDDSSMGETVQPSAPGSQAAPIASRSAAGGQGTRFGRYQLLRELGRGAMGTVYLAHDPQLDRRVALKIPHFQAGDDPEALARFYREARAVAGIDHPNLCHIFDVGEVDGVPYFTMAYIEGQSLAKYLQQHNPFDQRRAAQIVYDLARALAEAHAVGVIHRDLKPSNIMMNQRGEPVIMDFGLARRCNQDEALTHQGDALGTPAYMPPEQVIGDLALIGPCSDIYSLGVVLYELLTRRVPFRGTFGQVMNMILKDEPLPPREYRPDVDPQLEAICQRAVAKKVADRFATMKDFAAALESCRTESREQSETREIPQDGERQDGRRHSRTGSRVALAMLVLTMAVAVGVGARILLSDHEPQPQKVAVAIRSTPPGARVFVDNVLQSIRTDGTLQLTAGDHIVKVELDRYRSAQKTIHVGDAGETIDFPLQKLSDEATLRTVEIRSDPDGADVIFGDTPSGKKTNKATFRLEPGWHEFRLVRENYEPRKVKLEVTAGQDTQVETYRLVPIKPVVLSLEVVSKPAGAKVYIDDAFKGKTNDRFPIAPGKHVIRLELEGHKAELRKVVVASGEEPSPLQITLVPIRYTVQFTSKPAGADVFVDKLPPRQTPADLDLAPGPHKVKFVKAGYEVAERDFVVEGAVLQPINEVLKLLKGEQFYLLIGVNMPGKGLPGFVHAEADVAELGRVLVAAGCKQDHVIVLTRTLGERNPAARPTAANIRKRLAKLADGLTPGDSLTVALVGHHLRPDGQGEIFFAPSGAVLEDKKTLIPLQEVYDLLGRCKAQRKLLLLDGWRLDGSLDPPGAAGKVCHTRPEEAPHPEGLTVFSSCSPGESGFEDLRERHGLFFRALIRGLEGEADPDGGPQITLAALADYVRKATDERARKEHKGRQRPNIEGDKTGLGKAFLTVPPALAAYRRGRADLERGEVDLALAALNEAQRLDATFAETYVRRAEAYFAKGKYAEAIKDCQQALRLAPGNATALTNQADAHVKLGEFGQALECHDLAIGLDPASARAYNGRGVAYLTKADQAKAKPAAAAEDYDNAAEDFRKALDLNPTLPWPHHNLGVIYLNRSETKRAIEEFQKAAELDPSEARHHTSLGGAYRQAKDYKAAVASYTEAIRLDKKSAVAWQGRAIAYVALKKYDLAIDDYSEAIGLLPGKKVLWLGRGMARHERKMFEQAVADFTEAIRIDPNYGKAYCERARARLAMPGGDRDLAKKDQETARFLGADCP